MHDTTDPPDTPGEGEGDEDVRRAFAEIGEMAKAKRKAELSVVSRGADDSPPDDGGDGTTNELTTDWLPAPVRDWCDAMVTAYRVPAVLPVSAALCAAASVVQGRCRVRIKDGWEEPLSLYWITFVKTGGMKSVVMSKATAALSRWQDELNAEIAKDAKRVEAERKRHEAQLRRLRAQKRGSKWSEGYSDWLSEIKEIEHELSSLETPAQHDLFHGDINPSLVPKVMRRNLNAGGIARFSVLQAEGTFLANLMGRHQGTPILETMLSAYVGEGINVVRSQKQGDDYDGSQLPHTHATLCIFAQPHYYDLLADTSVLSTSGFTGRCVVDMVEGGRPEFEAPPVPDHVQDAYDAWVLRLAESDLPEVIDLGADPDSRAALKRCYEGTRGHESGTAKRIVGRVARIVALTELDDLIRPEGRDGEVVDVGDGCGRVDGGGGGSRARKIDLTFILIYGHRLRQVAAIDRPVDAVQTTAHRTHRWLSTRLRVGDSVSVREIVQGIRGLTTKAARSAIDQLADSGLVEWDTSSQSRYRGQVNYSRCRLVVPLKRPMKLVDNPAPAPAPDPDAEERAAIESEGEHDPEGEQ